MHHCSLFSASFSMFSFGFILFSIISSIIKQYHSLSIVHFRSIYPQFLGKTLYGWLPSTVLYLGHLRLWQSEPGFVMSVPFYTTIHSRDHTLERSYWSNQYYDSYAQMPMDAHLRRLQLRAAFKSIKMGFLQRAIVWY